MSSSSDLTIPTSSTWLVDALLAEQDDLTAVERFAQHHQDEQAPIQGRFYASLLPSAPPEPGQQLAFEVDLDRCSGCKACVAACHSLNGLDDEESWRDVGLIVGGTSRLPVLQHVTTACHHCVEPACLSACPVDAYEKDPITGIVKHLDDQCFGCQYCTLACPFDVPKFHKGKGIVRKCDMCADRLKHGEAPACVQACPHEAIRIRVVDIEDVKDRANRGEFLATAPDPRLTLPTTRFVSSRPLDPLRVWAADAGRLKPEHAHAPLVIMLVLTQMSVGAFAVDLLMRVCGQSTSVATTILLAIGIVTGHLGLAASTYHLGRPQYAFRALIGIRHSWLSREVAAFGLFAATATPHAMLAIGFPAWYARHPALAASLSLLSVVSGLLGVGCSVMVYHVTRRLFWHARLAVPRFLGTSALLGLAALLVAASWPGTIEPGIGLIAALGLMAGSWFKLGNEGAFLADREDEDRSPHERSSRLLKGPLGSLWQWRRGLAFIGGLMLPVVWIAAIPPMIGEVRAGVSALAIVVLIASEILERTLFFSAVVRPKMPGGMTS